MNGLADIIDAAADVTASAAKWLILAVAGLELVIFFARAVFGLSWPGLGETGLALNAIVVLFGGGTLLWTRPPLITLPWSSLLVRRSIHLGAGALALLFGLALLGTTLALARNTEEVPSLSDALLVGTIAIFSCWIGLSGGRTILREWLPTEAPAPDGQAES